MAIVSDLLQLCRLCLVKDEVNVPIFEGESDDQQISLKISSCLPVTLSQDDRLPQKICSECCRKLDTLYEFRNSSVNAEKQLVTWLEELENQSKKTSEKMSIATESLSEKTIVKEEIDEVDENGALSNEAEDYILQQQVAYDKTDLLNDAADETGEPQPKRAKRAAALKALIHTQESEEDEEDIDEPEPITKAEEESEPSETDINESVDDTFAGGPSTSADDQPGPSGVGKSTEGPCMEPVVELHVEEGSGGLFCCGKTFASVNAKRKHIKQHHQPKEYKCNSCDKMFANQYQLKLHSQIHISTKMYTCDLCEKSFKTHKYLDNHMNYNHIRGSFRHQCSVCDKSYRSEKELQQHVESKHEGVVYKCFVCFKDFYSDFYLKKHMLQHEDNYVPPTVPCTMCDKSFSCKRSLTVHVESFHNGIKHICEICGKSLSTQYSLRLHKRTHSDEKPFACEICGKRFAKSSTRQDHLRIHTNQRPHVCPKCGKGFTQRTPLITHMKSIHGTERPFKCNACEKAFATKSLLRTHSKVHGTPIGSSKFQNAMETSFQVNIKSDSL